MPVEQAAGADRRSVTHLEALGRARWRASARGSSSTRDATDEGRLRTRYADLARRAIDRAVDPASPDFLNFTQRRPAAGGRRVSGAGGAARAPPRARGAGAGTVAQSRRRAGVDARRSRRGSTTGCCSRRWSKPGSPRSARAGIAMRVDYALRQHDQWYKGDGAYGDGPAFHWDYYNSFVIQPMLLDVLDVCRDKLPAWKDLGVARRGARAPLRRRPRAADRARRQLPAARPLARVPVRRVPAAGADGAAARAAGRRLARAGARRADRRHPPDP